MNRRAVATLVAMSALCLVSVAYLFGYWVGTGDGDAAIVALIIVSCVAIIVAFIVTDRRN